MTVQLCLLHLLFSKKFHHKKGTFFTCVLKSRFLSCYERTIFLYIPEIIFVSEKINGKVQVERHLVLSREVFWRVNGPQLCKVTGTCSQGVGSIAACV